MMRIRTFFLFSFVCVLFFCPLFSEVAETQGAAQDQEATVEDEDTLPIRVLLAWEYPKNSIEWRLDSPGGFALCDKSGESCQIIKKNTIILSFVKGHLAIDGRRLAVDSVCIRPQDARISWAGNEYDGSFIFTLHDKKLYLLNVVDLEDYLFSVVRWESWPGWPDEVNRAIAIVCRTYVVNKIRQAREKDRLYDIKSTNIHQTYKGFHKFDSLRSILQETRGIVLAYNKEPIVAMYDSCCGGLVPADIDGIDFEKAPYLKREYPCTYCKSIRQKNGKTRPCKLYAWRLEYQLSDFEDSINADLHNAVPIKDIIISKKDKAGVVHEVIITTNGGARFALTGKKIYSLLKDVKSLCFSVKKNGKKVIFRGHGFGHHVGLCQWGAYQMVLEGWKYKDILHFYYPGVTFMKIKVI